MKKQHLAKRKKEYLEIHGVKAARMNNINPDNEPQEGGRKDDGIRSEDELYSDLGF
jgi:hypothetical protein